jgi:hypothetical protein
MISIYGLYEPGSNVCRYVGKTCKDPSKRLAEHIADSANKMATSPRFNWIRKLAKSGARPEVRLIESVGEGEWQEREKFWIHEMRKVGHPLLNCMHGGEGPNGYKFSDEVIQKMRAAAAIRSSDPEYRKRLGEAVRNAYRDPATRKRLSEALVKSHARPEVKARVSAGLKASLARPEARARMSATHKGKPKSAETRAKIGAAKIGVPRSIESRLKQAATMRGGTRSDLTKQRMREAWVKRREREASHAV